MIYHVTHIDLDGAACSVVLRRAFPKTEIKTFYVDYPNIDARLDKLSQEPAGDNLLFITDISPEGVGAREKLLALCKSPVFGQGCYILDHHKTAKWIADFPGGIWGEVCGARLLDAFLRYREVHYRETAEKAGAGQLPENVIPRAFSEDILDFVMAVDAYDRWQLDSCYRWRGEALQHLFVLLGAENFVHTFTKHLDWDEREGKTIAELLAAKQKREIALALNGQDKEENVYTDSQGRRFMFVVATSHVSEILNNVLCNGRDKKIDYAVAANLLYNKCELRSVPGGVDVSEIAKKFGGGGHQVAAGFSYSLKELATAPLLADLTLKK